MSIFLIILALLGVVIGASSLSQATMGVGFICGACLLAILARISQAYDQHQELIKKIDSKNKNVNVEDTKDTIRDKLEKRSYSKPS